MVAGLEALCVCSAMKSSNGVIYRFSQKVNVCTGYLLIQVQIESVCKKSLFVLAGLPKLSVDFLAVHGVWLLMDFLQCGCRCRCRYRSFCCRCRCRSFCDFCCLCIFHVFFLSFCKIQNWTQKKYFVLS